MLTNVELLKTTKRNSSEEIWEVTFFFLFFKGLFLNLSWNVLLVFGEEKEGELMYVSLVTKEVWEKVVIS